MQLSVGTFNLNNLFSRWNFRAEVSSTETAQVIQEIGAGAETAFRRYQGTLVKGKNQGDTERIARRIQAIDVDVLAVQEVEDIDTLKSFVQTYLAGVYPYVVLIEGNDRRLIDVALLSKLPIGSVSSWRFSVHPDDPSRPVFGRDVLQVDVLSASRRRKLLTVFNNHLKSHYTPWWMDDEERALEQQQNDLRRRRQAEVLAAIVRGQTRRNERFVVVGDMNDPPDAAPLAPLLGEPLGLVDGLADPQETRPPKAEDDPAHQPTTTAWTHRYRPSGEPPRFELLDQIWLSPKLAEGLVSSHVDRRRRHGGDGSDHDPAWVVVDVG